MEQYAPYIAATVGFVLSRIVGNFLFRFFSRKLEATYVRNSETLAQHGVYFGYLVQRSVGRASLLTDAVLMFFFFAQPYNSAALLLCPTVATIGAVSLSLALAAFYKPFFARISGYNEVKRYC